MLQEADTVGLFQVESRAQMATLPRLKPTCFYDLVVEVAIIRPGPIVGQMVHPYLARRRGDEPVAYAHPSLEPILKRTLGVPLFQEQLLRMAMVVAGFSGGEAEELRRAMGFKRSEARMRQIEVRLRSGMAERGITGETAETILRSISSFALYGFPESHAASFALIVYASAYLKAYYPAAFYTALLNNQPLGFYHPATLIKDAQRHGVRFLPVDVQQSTWACHITPDGAVRLGFCMVQGLREEVGRKLEAGSGERRTSSRAPAHSANAMPKARKADRPKAGCVVCPKCGADDRVDVRDRRACTRSSRLLRRLCTRLGQTGYRVPGTGYRKPRTRVRRCRRHGVTAFGVTFLLPRCAGGGHGHPARRVEHAREPRRAQRLRHRSPWRVVERRARGASDRRPVRDARRRGRTDSRRRRHGAGPQAAGSDSTGTDPTTAERRIRPGPVEPTRAEWRERAEGRLPKADWRAKARSPR